MNTNNKNSNAVLNHDYKILYFGYNMYGKLTQHVFTKMAIKNDDFYKINDIYQIKLMKLDLSFCRLVAKKDYKFHDIDDFVSYLDAGLQLKEYHQYLLTVLPTTFNLKSDLLTFCMFEKIIF
jgi:hypothetical protein